jgi:hypothetical protein
MRSKIFIVLAFSFFSACFYSNAQIHTRTDTLFISEINTFPAIDGIADDSAWKEVAWNQIGEIWMPWGNNSSNLNQATGLQLWAGPDDFTGRFKVVWSSESNLLYFVVEIIDDVFVDGYVHHENPNNGGGYPNYDIVEVFIDEDRSGGLHVFDGTGNVGTQWGTNAENAFSYHLAANAPKPDSIQKNFHALDIAGTNWGYPNQRVADYASHFPGFAMKREGNKFTWEFSLIVHDDSYNHSNQQVSVVTLHEGKILGLSMAYCDNDNPNESPLRRDHFFGSVSVPLQNHNDHWMHANWFGVAKLTANTTTSVFPVKSENRVEMNSYFAHGRLNVSVISPEPGEAIIRLIDLTGREWMKTRFHVSQGEWREQLQFPSRLKGVYLVEIFMGNSRNVNRIIIP